MFFFYSNFIENLLSDSEDSEDEDANGRNFIENLLSDSEDSEDEDANGPGNFE